MTAHLAFTGLHVQHGGDLIEHTTAVFDRAPDLAVYRYLLKCRWDTRREAAVWIGLNPSTATAVKKDLTVTKITEFSRRAGYGGFELVNLFALRATNPYELIAHRDPIGPRCDEILAACARHPGPVIAAWSDSVPYVLRSRAAAVLERLREAGAHVMCLGTTRNGSPRHPSRLGYDTPLIAYHPPQEED